MTKRFVASLLAAFLAGWIVNGWYTDSLAYVASQAARAAQDRANQREFDQAVALDKWLAKNATNERTIIRESVKLVDRPVYRNVCLDDDGLRLINAAKNGTSWPAEGMQNSR